MTGDGAARAVQELGPAVQGPSELLAAVQPLNRAGWQGGLPNTVGNTNIWMETIWKKNQTIPGWG